MSTSFLSPKALVIWIDGNNIVGGVNANRVLGNLKKQWRSWLTCKTLGSESTWKMYHN